MPGFELPVFSCAFVVGIFIKKIFDKTKTSDYVCPQTIGHISGAFTDFSGSILELLPLKYLL